MQTACSKNRASCNTFRHFSRCTFRKLNCMGVTASATINQSEQITPTDPLHGFSFFVQDLLSENHTTAHTHVFTQICAARLIQFFVSQVRRLFKSRIPQRQNILIVQFNLLNEYFFMVYRLEANLSFGSHNRFSRTLHSMFMS